MIQKVFAVYDLKAEFFMQPYFSESVGGAVRAFGDAANDKNSPLSKHPSDYQLFEIGSFDNVKGVMTALVPASLKGAGVDFVDPDVRAPLDPGMYTKVDSIIREAVK